MRRSVLIGLFGILGVVVLLAPWPGSPSETRGREVRIQARQYAYAPGVLRVSKGERITLILEAEDVTHGLYVDGYEVDLVAVPGRPARTTFVADRPGKFQIRCSKVCGTLHPFMLGQLVVGPNLPLWRAVALAILAAVGTVLVLASGRGGSSREEIA